MWEASKLDHTAEKVLMVYTTKEDKKGESQ